MGQPNLYKISHIVTAEKEAAISFLQSHIQYEVVQSRSWIPEKEAAISFSTRQWATLPSTITSWSKTIDGSAESIRNFLNRNRRKRSYYFIFQRVIFNIKWCNLVAEYAKKKQLFSFPMISFIFDMQWKQSRCWKKNSYLLNFLLCSISFRIWN